MQAVIAFVGPGRPPEAPPKRLRPLATSPTISCWYILRRLPPIHSPPRGRCSPLPPPPSMQRRCMPCHPTATFAGDISAPKLTFRRICKVRARSAASGREFQRGYPTDGPNEYLVNIVSGRRTSQERATGGRWRRIVLGDVLAEHVVELRGWDQVTALTYGPGVRSSSRSLRSRHQISTARAPTPAPATPDCPPHPPHHHHHPSTSPLH